MLKRCKGIALVLICLLLLWGRSISQQDSILLFVSDNDTYYSEYIVMYEALIASGYFVDVRNGGSAAATMYTIGGDITAQADMLAGSDYTAFTSQFQTMFGSTWNATLNAVPASIAVNDSIQNVPNMTPYKGLVVVGGTGAVDFRVDGTYASQGSLSATQVQSAAEKLNALAVEALLQGKPVMGQCHGASIPAYWRIPGTAPAGFDGLGLSLLSGSIATGFPEPATGPGLSNLNITFRPDDKVVVGNPDSLMHNGSAYFRIITTRDWFPQTVAHAAKTLTNIIESYPDPGLLTAPVSLLIIHGGAVNVANCGAGNQSNDVPCNYGSDPANLPADYTDLVTLYTSDQFSDSFDFVVSDVNLFATTPFDLNDELEILNYLSGFDVVFFYKHWSSQVTEALQNAIVDFADQGGGVVSIHHGLYNQNQGVIGKSILVDSLFQAHSPSGTWSANRTTYNIFQVNYGHFVSTNGIINDGVSSAPVAWTMPPLSGSNRSLSLYPRFQLFDEIYNNMQFVAGTNFGDGINEVNPIFSNDQTPSAQTHVHGFVKLFDGNGDGNVGRVVFGSPGETIANYEHPHPYAQFLRNAVYWARGNGLCTPNTTTWMVESGDWDTNINWSGNAVPDECSDVVIPDQVSEATVTVPNAEDISIYLLEVGLNVIFQIPLGTSFSVLGN